MRTPHPSKFLHTAALTLSSAFILQGNCTALQAQQPANVQLAEDTSISSSSLPSAPDAQTPSAPTSKDTTSYEHQHQDGQTTRILGIIPNFRAVNANVKLPPQTVKEKFVTATQDSFDYSSLVIPAMVAAYDYGRNSTPEFGSGGVGYGRYLWHSIVDQTDENYMVEFFVPAALHEDTRFYTLGSGGFKKRSIYALTRVVVTRSDSGKKVFNGGEVIGSGAAAGISNLYYPSRERTFKNTGENWAVNVGIDALAFAVKEFWPDINHALFHASKP